MTKTIDPVDAHVGKTLRTLRQAAGMSQTDLGNIIGVQFQQIQKYETGMNRISASRLKAAADALEAPISAFFAGLDQRSRSTPLAAVLADAGALALATSIHALPPVMRQSMVDILAVMSIAIPKNAA